MPTPSTGAAGRVPARGITPRTKAVVGTMFAVVSLALWFLPLPGLVYSRSVADLAFYRLIVLINRGAAEAGLSPSFGYAIGERLPAVLVVLTIVLLVVLPWWSALRHLRIEDAAISYRHAAVAAADEVRHLDDGRIIGDDQSLTGHIERTPRQLARLAKARRMRWHSDYDSPGGARVLLDLIDALDTGRTVGTPTGGVRDADPRPSRRTAPEPSMEPSMEPSRGAEPAPSPEPGRSAQVAAFLGLAAPLRAPDAASDQDTADPSAPSLPTPSRAVPDLSAAQPPTPVHSTPLYPTRIDPASDLATTVSADSLPAGALDGDDALDDDALGDDAGDGGTVDGVETVVPAVPAAQGDEQAAGEQVVDEQAADEHAAADLETSDGIGSVYTPTVLYTSSAASSTRGADDASAGSDRADDEEEGNA
ncbi:hypothetical protein ACXET9_02330 [Brachybacterium sp. DNPG3]